MCPGWLLLIAAGPQSLFNRWVLSFRVMVWIGLISYPLYLWHWPVPSFLRTLDGQEDLQFKRVIAVAPAFVLAWLTYQFVEMPVRRSAHKKSTVLALLGLMVMIGLFGTSAYLSAGFKNRSGELPEIANAR